MRHAAGGRGDRRGGPDGARRATCDIVVLSPTGTLRQGRNTFTIEFRSATGALVDVGTVRASANMTMPGMVMSGVCKCSRTDVPGRYRRDRRVRHGWRVAMAIEWDGPAGRGSVDFEGSVQ